MTCTACVVGYWWQTRDSQSAFSSRIHSQGQLHTAQSVTVLYTVPSLGDNSFRKSITTSWSWHICRESRLAFKAAGLPEFALSYKIIPVPVTKHKTMWTELQWQFKYRWIGKVSKAELHLSKRDKIPNSVLRTGQLAIMENIHFKQESLIGLD